MDYHGVKGHPNLMRDPRTNAVVSVDSNEYQQYVARRESKKKEGEKSSSIENDLANLKNEMNEIKSLLKELVSNVH